MTNLQGLAIFPTLEERRADPYGSLAITVLIKAILDYKDGIEEDEYWDEFWYGPWYETLCDLGGVHYEYYRRLVLTYCKPARDERLASICGEPQE